ncbi:MAG: hypothetical protein M1826_007205 [Phylliscum demangeonii]|nr:MAG: hypothetical protein M1826_007205 [Phylliscum demangeonii]
MATVNIRRDVTDPFYRYKMERLLSKIEGKGNGIKTVIVNLSSVAASLSRPPSYVIKYFGFELGAQTNTNPSDDRWIINGAHEASKLQDYLDGFIAKFVLCKKCENPETDVAFKDGRIVLDCKACGQRSDVNNRLKLSSFILKNQPKKAKKDKASKKLRKDKDKENGEANHGSPTGGDSNSDNGMNGNANGNANGHVNGHAENGENGEVEVDAGSDDELTRRIKAEARSMDSPSDDVKDDEWAVDVSEEAVRARAQELPTDFKRALILSMGDAYADDEDDDGGDPESSANSVYGQLAGWIVRTALDKGGVGQLDDVEIYLKAKELGIESKHRTLTVLAENLFDPDEVVKQIPKRAGMLKKMITDSDRHQKALLGGTERFVGKDHPKLIAQVPAILMAYYQHDLVSEEVVKKWGSRASKKYVDLATSKKVRKAAEKFLDWLENAESDEDEEDEGKGEEDDD